MLVVLCVFLGYKVKCLVVGSFFIYIVILNGFMVLLNKISIVKFNFFREGNIFCVVISKYRFDFWIFVV